MQVLEATWGGTRKYLLDLAYGLPRQRFDQHLVVSTLRDPGFTEEIDALREYGHEVTVVPMRREISPISDLRAFLKIRKLISTWHPHVVHSHSSKAGFLARMAGIGMPAVILYTPHCFAFQMRLSSVRRAMYLYLERFAGRFTDLLVLPSESQRQVAIAAGVVPAAKTSVVPTGIDPEAMEPTTSPAQMREQLDLSPDETVITTVALLSNQKGHRYLLAALRELAESHQFTALIVGDGPLEDSLRMQAQRRGLDECVRFLGHREDVANILGISDLFVLPSLWEGLPYALIEAMAAQVPVIATDISGNRALVDGSTTGWLAAPADSTALAEAIRSALDNAAQAQSRARLAKELVHREHTLQQMMDRYAQIYESAGATSDW